MYKYSSHFKVNESTLSDWDLVANDSVLYIRPRMFQRHPMPRAYYDMTLTLTTARESRIKHPVFQVNLSTTQALMDRFAYNHHHRRLYANDQHNGN
jgi:hypothetical protein